MGVVRVMRIANNDVMRVLNGQFMFQSDGHKGVFSPIDEPIISAEIAGGEFKSSPVVITREETI